MKKLILAFGIVCLSAAAFAQDSSDGCGLGWQVTQKKTFLATTTRGTTNAVVPPTFGMTSGTIGCEQHGFAKKDQQAIQFVAGNFEPLMIEMASGHGEYLEAFHQTLGCSAGSFSAFSSTMQKSFPSLSTGSSNVVNFYNNVKQTIKSNKVLAQSCNVI